MPEGVEQKDLHRHNKFGAARLDLVSERRRRLGS